MAATCCNSPRRRIRRCGSAATSPRSRRPSWLAEHAKPGARIGYDPLLISEEGLARYTEAGLTMVPVSRNPVDAVWTDRPPPPAAPAVPHPLDHAGRSAEEKRADIAKALAEAKQDAAVLTDPASIAWLLNIRGGDVPFTPFALGFALVHADGATELFMDPAKLPDATRAWLGNAVSVAGREALAPALARLGGKKVRVDPAGSPVWFAQTLREGGATVVAGPDPCLLPKACKNEAEQAGRTRAHARDAVAVCRFLHWLAMAVPGGGVTEMSAAAKLLALRREVQGFREESFPAISGAGEHGAIIHYRVTPESNRPMRANEVYLIDSGAQYPDGTTDITRTVWTGPDAPPAELRERVTRVLKGHIAIATLVFPQGVGGVASGRLRPARAVGGRAGLRPWHRARRRQLPVGARGAGGPVPSGAAGADCRRHDPVQRAGLLPARPLWHPAGEPAAGAAGRAAGGGQAVPAFRDSDPGAV